MNLNRHAILFNNEQLGPYPLEKLKRVDKIMSEYIGEVQQINESETVPPRISRGEYGEKPRLFMMESKDREPIHAALIDVQEHIATFEPAPISANKAEIPNDAMVVTRHIKSLGYFLGADMVGVCKMPKSAYYSHNGVGEKMPELNYKYAIVFMCRKNTRVIDASYGNEWIDDAISFQAYQRLICIATTVSDYICRLGWPALYSAIPRYANIMPQLVVESGLGEGSRMGVILNPFIGAVNKVSAVLTDLPLVPDKPIDFGLQEYCSKCTICADVCPSNSVTYGGKTAYNGYKVWRLRGKGIRAGENCVAYASTNNYGKVCGRCVSLCPWNRPDSTPKDFEGWDGDIQFLYDSVNRQAEFLREHNYVHQDESHKKWWLPLQWDKDRYVKAPEWNYRIHEHKMKLLNEEKSQPDYDPAAEYSYYIDNEKCKDCGVCIHECPVGVISGGKGQPLVIDQEKCLKCDICRIYCVSNAVIKKRNLNYEGHLGLQS